MNRRRAIAPTGTSVATLLAGCSSEENDGRNDENDSDAGDPTPTSTDEADESTRGNDGEEPEDETPDEATATEA